MHTTSTDSWSQRFLFRFKSGAKPDCKAIEYDDDPKKAVACDKKRNLFRALKTPKLDLSQVSPAYQAFPIDSPESPPPPEGCDEREVRRALLKLAGKPKRVKNLFIALLAAGPQVSPALVDKIAATIAQDSAALLFAVNLITGTDDSNSTGAVSPPRAPISVAGPPRERLRLPWAISNFILAGPAVLKTAVVNSKECLLSLTRVFTRINYDAARAAFAAGIIMAAINENPRMTANAVADNREFVKALVTHIDSAPAMDILTRLVATRDFTLHDPGAVVPAHKRAIASLHKFKIHKQLVNRFEHATKAENVRRPDSQIVCAHITHVLAEIHARALVIPKKLEDPDERYDGFGIAHLNIIPPSVYNDALDYLCIVLKEDSPLINIIDSALNNNHNHVKVCALELAAKALNALVNARQSKLPLVCSAAKTRKTAKFQKAFAQRIPAILGALSALQTQTQPTPGSARIRTACVDTLCAFMDIAELSTLKDIVIIHRALDALLEVIKLRPHDNMNTLRISKTVASIMKTPDSSEAAAKWTVLLEHSNLLEYMESLEKGGGHFRDSIDALTKLVKLGDDLLRYTLSDSRRKLLDHITDDSNSNSDEESRMVGLFKEVVSERQDSKTSERELALANKSIEIKASEDKGKILYARSLTRRDNKTMAGSGTILEAVFSRRSGA